MGDQRGALRPSAGADRLTTVGGEDREVPVRREPPSGWAGCGRRRQQARRDARPVPAGAVEGSVGRASRTSAGEAPPTAGR